MASPLLSLEVASPKKQTSVFEAVICMEESAQEGAEVRLTSGSLWEATHPSCDPSNTSRRFALGERDVCLLVSDNARCSVLVL